MWPVLLYSHVAFRYQLSLWDIGGQRSIRSYWRNYFETTDGLIWVVDSTDVLRLEDCRQELSALLVEEVCFMCSNYLILNACSLQRLAGATLLVMANKQDVAGALSPDEIKDALGLDAIKSRHWSIFSCSAHSGVGIQEGMRWLTQDISARVFVND